MDTGLITLVVLGVIAGLIVTVVVTALLPTIVTQVQALDDAVNDSDYDGAVDLAKLFPLFIMIGTLVGIIGVTVIAMFAAWGKFAK